MHVRARAGVTVGVVVCFILPASLYRKALQLHGRDTATAMGPPLAMIIFACCVSVLGLATLVYDLVATKS